MSSLDACVAKLEKDSGRLFDEFTENLEAARRQLGQRRYIRLLQTPEETGEEKDEQGTTEIFDYDRSKLILSTLHSSLNGPELAGILRRKYHLEVEMTTENYVLALAAVGDTREGFRRLCKAIEDVDGIDELVTFTDKLKMEYEKIKEDRLLKINENIAYESAEKEVIKKEKLKDIANFINNLKEPDKTYFYLKYFINMESKEIAKKYNTTLSSVENRLYRCRLALKKIIDGGV